MTANELADELTKMFRGEEYDRLIHEIPDMLRQQAQEIAMLKQIIDANNLQLNIGQLKKELALQRLSDFSQEIEDRESAIYATGYWNGIQKAKEKNETLDTRSYLIGRYDGLRELSDATIRELSVSFMLVLRRTSEDELFESVYEYSKLLLKKARGE